MVRETVTCSPIAVVPVKDGMIAISRDHDQQAQILTGQIGSIDATKTEVRNSIPAVNTTAGTEILHLVVLLLHHRLVVAQVLPLLPRWTTTSVGDLPLLSLLVVSAVIAVSMIKEITLELVLIHLVVMVQFLRTKLNPRQRLLQAWA